MTVGDLRQLLSDEVPDGALVLVSVYSEDDRDWLRVPVTAAEVRKGFNSPAVLVIATDEPEHALS